MKEKEAGENAGRKIVEIAGRKVRYIDPLTDWGFKRLFGTEANKEILSGFLEVLFPDKVIRDIRYLNPEQLGVTREDRKSVFDVCCKTDSGEEFIVEMQRERQNYFRDRALYYSTYPLREQGRKGDWNYRLTPVYMVGILDFTLDHPAGNGTGEAGVEEKLIYRYSLRESETGEEMTENLRFVFVELGTFRKSESELRGMLDKWMYVLKNLSRLIDRPAALQERIFGKIFETAEISAFTKEERNQYENNMMTENDRKNALDYARQEGRQAGLEEGRREGRQEGIAEGRQEGLAEGEKKGLEKGLAAAAAGMKKMGMPVETIMQVTGLSEAAIAAL